VHRGQLGGGVGAELLGERPPAVLEHGQGLGLPAAGVQRPHQLSAQPLPQRVRGDQLLQLRDQGGVAAERQLRLDPVLDGADAQLLQADRLRPGEGQVLEVGERRPAPQVERLAQQPGGARCLAGGEGATPLRGEPLEPARVDLVGLDRQPVAGRVRLDRRAGPVLSRSRLRSRETWDCRRWRRRPAGSRRRARRSGAPR
jgi:hypothetical protein